MTEVAVTAERLGKRFHIGVAHRGRTLRDVLVEAAKAPFRRMAGDAGAAFWALKDVSFEVQRGEVLGIIGRNGAGKSTLLKILSRITRPTTGHAEVRGRVASLLEVGTGFHPELSGRENIVLNGAVLGMSSREVQSKFDEIVAFAEVERFIDTPVKRYSSGMYLRLAFAVAAHLEPEILIVDEVLAVGDAAFQEKCLGKMKSVSSAGRTVLFVSHNLQAVASLCGEAIWLEGGTLRARSRSREIVEMYLSGVAERKTFAGRTGGLPGSGLTVLSAEVSAPGVSPTLMSVAEPILLVIRYRTERDGLTFRCAIVVTCEGAPAFSSVERVETRHEPGAEYVVEVEIPPRLLTEAEYALSLSLFSSRGTKEHLFKMEDVLRFRTFDPLGDDSVRGDYRGRLAGVLAPGLTWRRTRVDDAGAPAA